MPSLKLQQVTDKDTPISFPLKTISELRDWVPDADRDKFNVSNVPLQRRMKTNALRPRLMLCHDMAGGYKEDKLVQGNDYSETYYIQNWHLVDTFIYFSHERVSIPPVNWTNACHRNGVKCLGTFLVEGNTQMHEMEALLNGPPFVPYEGDEDPMRLWSPFYADKLVAVAKYYGFDGWLFNIECEFFPFPTNPKTKAEELAKFLHYFTQKMHEEIPGSQVIWYDSMTKDGEIHWQNQLTWNNEVFFKITDGIFLNYWWKKEYPEMARRRAEQLGRSGLDVYFGTDVWGRHTYGGGGFQSYKGVKAASSAQTSSALFGMAWTYEHFDKADWERMDYLFWNGGNYSDYPPPPPKDPKDEHSIESDDSEDELMYGYKKGIADVVSAYPAPGKDWFVTTFDRGFGKRFYYRGKKLLNQPWSHLSHEAVLPNLKYRNPHVRPVDKNIKFTSSLQYKYGAFTGGTSLVINGQRLTHRESRDTESEVTVPLYKLNLDVSKGSALQYIYRTLLMEDVKLTMSCHFSLQTTGDATAVKFFNSWQPESSILDIEDGFRATITTTDNTESRCLLLPATKETTGENDWITKTIDIPAAPNDGSALYISRVEVSVVVNTASLAGLSNHVIACLGYLSIIPTEVVPTAATTVDEEEKNVLVNLTWKDKQVIKVKKGEDLTDIAQEDVYRYFGTLNWTDLQKATQGWKETDYYMISYEVDNDPNTRTFLGTAFCNEYRISGLESLLSKVPKVVIEAVDREGYIYSKSAIDIS